MRFLSFLFFLAVVAFVGMPYYTVYKLDNALTANSQTDLSNMVDLEAVKKTYQQTATTSLGIEKLANQSIETGSPLGNLVVEQLKQLGQNALQETVDLNWVRNHLLEATTNQKIMSTMNFAFFESPTRFVVRIRELGNNPVFVVMTLQDWSWRITGLYF
ncbi:DUF2939 domain-containing protein [Beggiatoa leptomitoformis]|uniref:DUF2939 domain-containing protein n=1 Tax=Beggiatoa leptomitoformis TaxID=288004 RepID=A0A2N9YC20_9GAMM|nr:DUF2939 domain-containing protein [Beggiatoa leptomitoformis]ALG66714.1 DUF2939 domain-containing protein [Beggiatoa leptomitoformis]AUI67954.1 DUF2939 domain-containing protein [Beggiatoa leptomitoformis]